MKNPGDVKGMSSAVHLIFHFMKANKVVRILKKNVGKLGKPKAKVLETQTKPVTLPV